MRQGGQNSKGFTIVELLIVVVVIAILAAITIVAYRGIKERSTVSAVQSALSQGVKKVLSIQATTGAYPLALADTGLVSTATTQYYYKGDNSNGGQFCLTASNGTTSYFETNAMPTPTPGTCEGMLAWWPFDGNAQDMSGFGVHGTVNGATLTAGVSGEANGAYQLGETAQYINIGTPTSFSVLPSGFTYSVWVARTGTSTNQWPTIMGASNTHVDFGLRTSSYGAAPYLEWGNSPYDGVSFSGITSVGSLATLGEWHHLVVTYTGTAVTGYWDGVQKVATTGTVTVRPTMSTFTFTTSANGWQGKVDDARVFSRALSAAEIQTLYAGGAQ